jgi:excisionase family DNA binding protein
VGNGRIRRGEPAKTPAVTPGQSQLFGARAAPAGGLQPSVHAPDALMSLEEAAGFLAVSVSYLRGLVRSGRHAHVRVGRLIRLRRATVAALAVESVAPDSDEGAESDGSAPHV